MQELSVRIARSTKYNGIRQKPSREKKNMLNRELKVSEGRSGSGWRVNTLEKPCTDVASTTL
jgi:hypothetical protein